MAVVIVVVVELALAVFCIVDIVRRPAVLGGRKWLWVLLIVLFTLPGSIIYIAVGRVPAPAEETPENGDTLPRAAAAASSLYGQPAMPARPEAVPAPAHAAVPAPVDPAAPPGVAAPAAEAGAAPAAPPAPSPLAPAAARPASPQAAAASVIQAQTAVQPGGAPAISISGLTKEYKHAKALAGVDLMVPEGSVFGFLGPNGAGKTTTLRILAGLARPTCGAARIFGNDTTADADTVHGLIGYLPDVPGFYKWMTAREYLELSAGLFGLPAGVRGERIDTLLELAGLSGVTTKVGGYSRGMKQRLGVAQALINSPRLLLLDEPTSALDPIGRREVLEMIAALAGRTTVFFSTHILADVERVCDTVAVLAAGRVVEQAAIGELRSRHGGAQRVVIECSDPQALVSALAGAPWAGAVRRDGRELLVEVTDLELAFREVPALVARLGLALRRFEADEVSLEDVFVDLVQGATA
ncbi:MAG TPA: ATP-binding cassette domain-containing protein [Thermoleophilia bacterium]|nr:ATP-binding cassette domain-containing protein [Thermoleophilia bacterium]